MHEFFRSHRQEFIDGKDKINEALRSSEEQGIDANEEGVKAKEIEVKRGERN